MSGEMIELIPDSGVALLHAWGLPEWPREAVAKYFLWERCCVFAIMANDEGGIDGHMAMAPPSRRRSREACLAFLDHWGEYQIRVPVLASHRHARNVVKKVGFVEYPPEQVELVGGEMAEIIFLRRGPNGRSYQWDR